MKKSNKRAPLVFYIGVFLLVMTMFSINMTSGLYARYVAAVTSSDGARVAKFDVLSRKKEGVEFNIALNFFDPEKQTDNIEFEVTSSGEVAVRYDVVLVLSEETMSFVQDGSLIITIGESVSGTVDSDSKTVTFTGDSFSPNSDETHTHKITFKIKEGTMVSPDVNVTETATLRIHAEQID